MKLILPYWTAHHNMLIFSYLYFCEENNVRFSVSFDSMIPVNGAIIYYNNQSIFFDFSDNIFFIDLPQKYNFYFKRSLVLNDCTENVYPLNFQVNFSYKSWSLLMKLKFNDLISNSNKIEIFRAIDYFNSFTNLSHNAMDIRRFPKKSIDNNGKVIFHTRLWNPANHPDNDEKERRIIQNEFRIQACRILKSNFKNFSVGLYPDKLTLQMAPDLVLDKKKISKQSYFELLERSDIAIADDGLKDTPGWKIGEYLLFGKAVITTPLNVCVENFHEGHNYEKLSSRSSYLELPDKIESLLEDKKYLKMGSNNLIWSDCYLHPKNYIKRIISFVEEV